MSDKFDAMNWTSPLSPREVPITPRSVPVGRDYRVLPPIQGLGRRPSESLPSLEQRRTLPSIPSLQPPGSLRMATSPESDSNNSRVLPPILPPPIRSALAESLSNAFSSISLPRSAKFEFLPQPVSPGPFSHLSPVGTENASKKPLPAMAAAFSPRYMMSHTTPMSLSFLPTRYQVSSDPGLEKQGSFSSPPSTNRVLATNSYNCTYPRRTAVLFQPQSLVKRSANAHSQDRPYPCPITDFPYNGKGFECNDVKNRHYRTHFPPSHCCPSCGNMYARLDTLHRHVRDQHRGTNKNDPQLQQACRRCHSKAMTAQDIDI